MADPFRKDKIRVLKFLNSNPLAKTNLVSNTKKIELAGAGAKISMDLELIIHMIAEGLIHDKCGSVAASAGGKSFLKRALFPENPFVAQQGDLAVETIKVAGVESPVIRNGSESTLSRLYLRKAKNGRGWIDEYEFQAGERLRADFERAQLQPRISASWEASVAGKNRGGNLGAELSDFSLDARGRIEKAMEALGPELAGIALDICCFLKGLEEVERSKGWPPRSAKLMLKTALASLVRHYGIKQQNHKTKTRHWGSENYRPRLNG